MDGTHNMTGTIEHFEIVSIELPYVSGTCTVPNGVNWSQGYHTPLTCVESSDATWTYYFGTGNVPLSVNEFEAGHPIYRQIKSINETTPTLQQASLASRGSLNITFVDFKGDPGPINKTENGTYFSKFAARNFLNGRVVKIYRYERLNGVNSLVSASEYLSEAFKVGSGGTYTLSCTSRLERTYKDFNQFPTPTGAKLRADIDETVTAIPVFDGDYDWSTLPVIRIGDDLMTSTAYDSPTQTLTVESRLFGVKGSGGNVISRTVNEEHDEGDDIQVCIVSDAQDPSEFLAQILTVAELPASYINIPGWQAEFSDYWGGSTITTVWSEPRPVKEILEQMCDSYMLDIWEDANESKIKVSAVSTWKEPAARLEVGRGITESVFSFVSQSDARTSRAYIYYDKAYKTENDDRGNFKKLSINSDITYEGDDFYGSVKEKELTPSELLNTNDAALRTQRHVSRYKIEPVLYSFDCEEKYLNFKTGDVVDFTNQDLQDVEGNAAEVRAQITNVTPRYKYKGLGRAYSVKALTYLPAIIQGGSEFIKIISGVTVSEVNIWNDYAERIATPVDILIIFDNCKIISDDTVNPSIRNGQFATGSTITIILANGTDWQAKGGDGGNGAKWVRDYEPGNNPWDLRVPATAGKDGGVCFDADGIESHIYLAGATPNPTYPTASGFLRAPGGGGGGSGGNFEGDPGDGGGGGAGDVPGLEGAAGSSDTRIGDLGSIVYGNTGTKGDNLGNGGTGVDGGDGGDWGQNGLNGIGIGGKAGGLAGKGLVKNGASVTIYGDTPTNFINGSGETPD